MSLKVLLVDDHPVVLQGLSAVLQTVPELDLVATARSAEQARRYLDEHDVDVAVVDLQLGAEPGLGLITEMRSLHPDVVSLVFTMANDSALDGRVRRAGASGLVSKAAPVTALIDAILNGGTPARSDDGAPAGEAALTERERDIVQRLVDGATPSQIAAALELAPSTVSTHLKRARQKLGARSVGELIRRWVERRTG